MDYYLYNTTNYVGEQRLVGRNRKCAATNKKHSVRLIIVHITFILDLLDSSLYTQTKRSTKFNSNVDTVHRFLR